ncbi:hypothetical protein WJX84_011385 [Apatococcus fuscideae]|uniref:Uncharacterized protein n=1 Tax=Apatococcus fuscideae TaxID=2026836 RepID=A0AAW1T9G0_9CHLO
MTSLVGLCVTLLLAAASASSSPAALEEAPNQQASFEASHPDPADLYDPAVLLDNYTATLLPLAWELQMGPDHARRLTAVSSPPPPPNPLKLKGGIVIYDSTFNNIAVGAGFGFLTITEGTTPVVIQNSAFTGITTCVNLSPSSIPTCFPALVASQPTVRIWA